MAASQLITPIGMPALAAMPDKIAGRIVMQLQYMLAIGPACLLLFRARIIVARGVPVAMAQMLADLIELVRMSLKEAVG